MADLEGMDAMIAKMRAIVQATPRRAAAALYQEAEIIMAEAKRRTPVDTAALRNSGTVTLPVVRAGEVTVQLEFGGPAAPHAVFVHEDLEAHHPVGQAKFLESAMHEAVPGLASRLAARVALE